MLYAAVTGFATTSFSGKFLTQSRNFKLGKRWHADKTNSWHNNKRKQRIQWSPNAPFCRPTICKRRNAVCQCHTYVNPDVSEQKDLKDYITQIDGVLLTGGRANIEPHHFGGKKFPKDEIIDPARDYTALNLIKECSRLRIQSLGFVAEYRKSTWHGGTLIYRVHERSDKKDHRMPQNDDASVEEIFKPRHIINIPRDSLLESFWVKVRLLLIPSMVKALIGSAMD